MLTADKWKKEKPQFEGLYLVAIRYPNGLGALDILNWSGSWSTLYDNERIPDNYHIVGYMSTSDIINSLKGNWPEWDAED